MKNNECQLNTRLPQGYYDQVKKLADASDISISGFFRAVVQYCIDNQVKIRFEPRVKGMPLKKVVASLRRDGCRD